MFCSNTVNSCGFLKASERDSIHSGSKSMSTGTTLTWVAPSFIAINFPVEFTISIVVHVYACPTGLSVVYERPVISTGRGVKLVALPLPMRYMIVPLDLSSSSSTFASIRLFTSISLINDHKNNIDAIASPKGRGPSAAAKVPAVAHVAPFSAKIAVNHSQKADNISGFTTEEPAESITRFFGSQFD